MKSRLKKIGKFALKLILIAFVTLCILEVAYRFQWIDFYNTEWTYQNDTIIEDSNKSSVLVFGDSFTAGKHSWVQVLRKSNSNTNFYNAALPGVGVETYSFIFKDRIEASKPDKIIIQLYAGNDLYDINKPINWSSFSFARNTFWSVSNNFRFLNYLNYRAGQISTDVITNIDPKTNEKFESNKYSKRTLMFIDGDDNYPESQSKVIGDAINDFEELVDILNDLKSSTDITIELLVIPHCTEVSNSYRNNYMELGSKLNKDLETSNTWVDKLKGEGFNCLDPTMFFRGLEGNGVNLYYLNDPHLNKLGQRKLAEWIQLNAKI